MLSKVLGFFRTMRGVYKVNQVTVDAGGGDLRTATMAGDDQQPLETDLCVVINGVVVGIIDGQNAGKTEPGERRIYSRNSSGEVKAVIYLMADGTVEINGATITATGDVVTAKGVSLDNHVHVCAPPGNPSGVPSV